jgi:hypothetical protein
MSTGCSTYVARVSAAHTALMDAIEARFALGLEASCEPSRLTQAEKHVIVAASIYQTLLVELSAAAQQAVLR